MKDIFIVIIWGIFSVSPAEAHHGHHHENEPPAAPNLVESINASYVKSVKALFDNKCGDCHGSNPVYPFYYRIPGSKQLIDHDISEAHEHLDIGSDFPFKGHGSIQDNFSAIREDVEGNEMPPWRYWIFHWNKRLTGDEKKVILQWVDDSERLLKTSEPPTKAP